MTKKALKSSANAKDIAALRSADLADSAAKAWQSTNGYAEQYLAVARGRAPELADSARVYSAQLAERAADEGVKLSARAKRQAKKAQKAAAKLQ